MRLSALPWPLQGLQRGPNASRQARSGRAPRTTCIRPGRVFENPLAGIRQRTHRERRRQATGVGFSDASVVTVTSGVPGPIVGAGLPVVTAVCHRGNHSPLSPCSRLHCSARRRTLASACMRSNACCRDEGALRHGDAAASMALIMVLRSRALEMSMLRCLARRRISGVLTRRSSSPILSFLKGQIGPQQPTLLPQRFDCCRGLPRASLARPWPPCGCMPFAHHEGAFDLVPGLRSLDKRQAGIHGYLGNAAARQAGSRNELRQRRIYKGAGGSSKCLLQFLPPLARQTIRWIGSGNLRADPLQLYAHGP